METKEKFILMFKDYEVLSFVVIYGERDKIELLEELEYYDRAPYGMKKAENKEEANRILYRFFNARAIPCSRWDYDEIIKATGCKDSLRLIFKGHGLSLSNHYWFKKEGENLKYDDINFFTNKWDDTFARAVLSHDYEKLKTADLNVPDILTPGWGVKGWLCEEDGPRLYKAGIHKGHYEECLGEVLASRLANRLLNKGEALEYELKTFAGQYCSVCKTMINIDEELVPLSQVLPRDLYLLYSGKSNDRQKSDEFFKRVPEYGLNGLYEFFVKITCIRSLVFVSDLHFDNLSIIRNMKTGELKVAPLYDLGGSFGSGETGKKVLSNINKGTYLLIYFIYGGLDPNWDYSWYDKNKLIGFEDEIRDILSKSDFYNEQLIDNIIDVYHHQKETLDELADNCAQKSV